MWKKMKKKTEIVIKIQSKNLRSKECLNREKGNNHKILDYCIVLSGNLKGI